MMKIFLSYGHDSNGPLIEKMKDNLSKVAEGNLKHEHEVWINTSGIKVRKDNQRYQRKRCGACRLPEHLTKKTITKENYGTRKRIPH